MPKRRKARQELVRRTKKAFSDETFANVARGGIVRQRHGESNAIMKKIAYTVPFIAAKKALVDCGVADRKKRQRVTEAFERGLRRAERVRGAGRSPYFGWMALTRAEKLDKEFGGAFGYYRFVWKYWRAEKWARAKILKALAEITE